MFKSKEQALIEKLPKEDKERNEWLMRNGIGEEVEQLKVESVLNDTSTSLAEKSNLIMNIFRPKTETCSPQPRMPQAPERYNDKSNRW